MFKILFTLTLSLALAFASAQSLTNIPLPESCTIRYYSENDTISVVTTVWNNMYYRYKHDTTWTQITLPFNVVNNISVYNTHIYAFGISTSDTSLCGIMVSTDFGNTWTRKVSQSFLIAHNFTSMDANPFASNDNEFAFTYGGNALKKFTYFSGVTTDITPSFGLIPCHKLQYWNGTLYYYEYNQTNGSVIGGEVLYAITNTVWGSHGIPSNGLQMVATERGNDMLFVDRGSGLFFTSTTGGFPFNQWSFNSGSDYSSYFQVICGYGKFYVYKDDRIYYSSNGTTWSNFYNTSVPQGTFLEVLPNGNLLMNCGTLLEYNPVTQTFKPFTHGISEPIIKDAYINSSNDVLMIADNLKYYKASGQIDWKLLFNLNDLEIPHIADNGNLYLHDYWQMYVSSDSGNTFSSTGSLYSDAMFHKNDSVLILRNDSIKMSADGGSTIIPMTTPSYSDAVIYLSIAATNFDRNQLMIDAVYASFYHQLFYTTGFGNTWITSDTVYNSNVYGTSFAIDNDPYYLKVNNFSTDTIYKILPGTDQLMTVYQNNPADTIIEKNFWVDDNHLYFQQIIKSGNQYLFEIYRSLNLNGSFTQLFSIPVTGVIGQTPGNFANCKNKKLFWMARNQLFLFDDNTVLSVNETEHANNILIYPNPVSDKLNFVSSTQFNSLKLYNVLGKEVYYNKQISSPVSITINDFPEGIYFYELTGLDGVLKSGRFIKN